MKYGSGVVVSLVAVMMVTFSVAATFPYAEAAHDKATVSVSFYKKGSIDNFYHVTVSGGATTIEVPMTAKDFSAFKRVCGSTSVDVESSGGGGFERCEPGKGIHTISILVNAVHDGTFTVNVVKASKN